MAKADESKPMAKADESKPHTTRNYILAALGGTIAATAVVIVVSVVLSPAHITFSVTRASRSPPGKDGAQYLNLTITAANGSQRRRVAVRYQSVFVDLKNSTSAAGKDTIHLQVDARPAADKYLLPGEPPANIRASTLLVGGDWTKNFGISRREEGDGFTVVVTAQVRFKVGAARTRLYDIKVSCPRVLFPLQASLHGATQQPFNCTG